MTLSQVNIFIKSITKYLLIGTIVGFMLGVSIYIIYPVKYTAQGTFYIFTQNQQTPPSEFNYEGFYAQQNAISFVSTAIGIIESPSTTSQVLASINVPVTQYNIKKYNRILDVKKTAPQLISIKVKTNGFNFSNTIWNEYAKTFISEINKINKLNSQDTSIIIIGDAPLITKHKTSVVICAFSGALIGFICVFAWFLIKDLLSIKK